MQILNDLYLENGSDKKYEEERIGQLKTPNCWTTVDSQKRRNSKRVKLLQLRRISETAFMSKSERVAAAAQDGVVEETGGNILMDKAGKVR